ncbi:MAG: hypothetical protein HYX33_01145 [Actinobacteria bacterium]|nr:hypothetical protein [Actinomycetota bacterium]
MTPVDVRASRATSSCRRCAVSCDKIVYPMGCIESGCDRLYTYEESGRTYVGCLAKVFRVEIDRDLMFEGQGRRGGFGALRVTGDPFPICRTAVEVTFPHRAEGACVNPDFRFSAPHREFTVVMNEPQPDS